MKRLFNTNFTRGFESIIRGEASLMRKLLMLCLLVTLLSNIVFVPGALAGGPDQTSEPVELIGITLDSSELSVTADEGPGEDGAPDGTLGESAMGEGAAKLVPNSIRGSDNRQRVWTATEDPYRAIVHLEITRADGKQDFCTGFFVRPNRIMTAGHCVYQYDETGRPITQYNAEGNPIRVGWVSQVKVIPARSWQWENGQRVVKKPFGEDFAVYLETTTAWVGDQYPGTHDHDFGFVILPDRTLFDGQKGTNGGINTLFRLQDSVLSMGHGITISGYPCDSSWFVEFVRDENCGHPENPPMDAKGNRIYPTGLWEMWTDTATINGVTPSNNNPLQYRTSVDTMPGQDGGPCWFTEQRPDGPTYVAAGVYVEETSTSNNCVVFRSEFRVWRVWSLQVWNFAYDGNDRGDFRDTNVEAKVKDVVAEMNRWFTAQGCAKVEFELHPGSVTHPTKDDGSLLRARLRNPITDTHDIEIYDWMNDNRNSSSFNVALVQARHGDAYGGASDPTHLPNGAAIVGGSNVPAGGDKARAARTWAHEIYHWAGRTRNSNAQGLAAHGTGDPVNRTRSSNSRNFFAGGQNAAGSAITPDPEVFSTKTATMSAQQCDDFYNETRYSR